MSKRYSIEDIREKCKLIGSELLSEEYTGIHDKHLVICPSCKKPVEKYLHDVFQGHVLCQSCAINKAISFKRLTLEEVREKAKSVGSEFLDDEFINSKHKHTFKCFKCGNAFKRSLNDVTRIDNPRIYCMDCAVESRVEKRKMTEEKFNECKKYYKDEYHIEILSDYKDYIDVKTKNLHIHCDVCNLDKQVSISQLKDLTSGLGCGCSSISIGEKETLIFLEQNGIEYEFQKRLPNGLYADFEIKLDNNKVLLLEIDGSQHYFYMKVFHKTQDDFLKQQENDKIKDKWYKDQGFDVIRVKYEKDCAIRSWVNDDLQGILNDILIGKYGLVKRKEVNKDFSILNIAKIPASSRRVLAYTLNGKFYKCFNSIRECLRELGVSNFYKSELNNKSRHGDYMLRIYTENFPLQIEPYDGKLKKLNVYKDDNFLGTFDSLRAVDREFNIPRHKITDYLNGKNVLFEGNYHFEYAI